MAITLSRYNLAYFPAPKTACTSMKHLFYFIEHQKQFELRQENGKWLHIHATVYNTPKFTNVDLPALHERHRIAIVRDPVERMISAYSNRVLYYEELSPQRINVDLASRLGVAPNPSLDDFVEHLEKYRMLSPTVLHHTDSLASFLGSDLDYYHRVYPISKLDVCLGDIERIVRMRLEMPRLQEGGPKIPIKDVKRRTLKRLVDYCAGDYALLRGIFAPPLIGEPKALPPRKIAATSGLARLLG